MRVMVIGGGGREHALAHGLARSARVEEVLCVPGNAGTALVGENIECALDDHDALANLAHKRAIDLTVVGPEGPLCAGIVDRFEEQGQRIFGPCKAAARLEGDKAFAKKMMKRAQVPTAEGRVFQYFKEAREYVTTRESGVVVKAAGLAAGKGVAVCANPEDALVALERIMVERAFGPAGDTVIVEELLKGQELSVFALVDGRTIYTLESAQDHKAVGEGDVGPNTGGMGAFSPAPIATPKVISSVERDILVPIVDALHGAGTPYRGLLYVGLMLTPAGPKVLEFNCRFGDPETQAVLMRLESDLYTMLESVVDGRLAETDIRWSEKAAVCVVLASQGYPGPYETGKVIDGLDDVADMEDVNVFHAGTRRLEHLTVSAGGRVLGVTGLGTDTAAAKRRAYEAVERIHFDNAFWRKDIADKAIPASG